MIQVSIAKHAVAFPSKTLASNGGRHIYNIHLAENKTKTEYVDNGWFVGKGAWEELDLYTEAAPTSITGVVRDQAANGNWYVEVTADPVNALFVYQVPMIEEEYNNNFKKESNYTNKYDQVVRAYELAVGDIVEVSADGFSATPTKGATVTLQSIAAGVLAMRLGA